MHHFDFYIHPRLYLTILIHNTTTNEIINYNFAKQLNDKYITCVKKKVFDTPHSNNFLLAHSHINSLLDIYKPDHIYFDERSKSGIDWTLISTPANTKIISLPYFHEDCHIASSQLENGGIDGLVLSYDGYSSNNNATFICEVRDNKIVNKDIIPIYFGRIYEIVSWMLSLTPGKLMGFQSYGNINDSYISTVRDIILKCSILYDPLDYVQNYLYLIQKIKNIIGPSSTRQEKADFTKTFQTVWLEEVLNILKPYRYKYDHLSITGGCALNGIANTAIMNTGWFKYIHFNPMPDDSGQALGLYTLKRSPIEFNPYCGTPLSGIDLMRSLTRKYKYIIFENDDDLTTVLSEYIHNDKIIGHIRGNCEIGPRALGNRSILASPLNKRTRDIININIKNREDWRPFGPMCLEEDADKYFDISLPSKYMSLVTDVKTNELEAITHVDNTTRPQTVGKDNKYYYSLLQKVKQHTGYSVILNTSFNQGGKPTLNSLDVAADIFDTTPLDVLVINNYMFIK